jgi:hypothetical protein
MRLAEVAGAIMTEMNRELIEARAEIARLTRERDGMRAALEGLLSEWDKLTRYGSPMAKAANERVAFARAALSPSPGETR